MALQASLSPRPPSSTRRPSSNPRTSPQQSPGVSRQVFRDFGRLSLATAHPVLPRLAAFADRRLRGRLDGQSPAVGLQNRHQPRTFPSRAATSLSTVSAVGFDNVRKQLNQPLLNRPHRRLRPVLNTHLSKDVLDVLFDGLNAYRKASGDFIIGQPVTNVA
jgi:hypothetical protein